MTKKKPGDWWDKSWSVVTGCTPVGAGCDKCWAAALVRRFPAAHCEMEWVEGHQNDIGGMYCEVSGADPVPFSRVKTHPDRLDIPFRAKKPRVYAVSLLGDLFHEEVPYDFILEVLTEAKQCNFDRDTINPGKPMHTFVLLTKRWRRSAEVWRMALQDKDALLATGDGRPDGYTLPSFILLASVWDQASTDAACAAFSGLPVRWGLHMEPLLSAVKFPWAERCPSRNPQGSGQCGLPVGHDEDHTELMETGAPWFGIGTPSWIVVGSENGPGARPFDLDWARNIQDQCKAAGVPYWFKSAYKQQVPDEMLVREVPW